MLQTAVFTFSILSNKYDVNLVVSCFNTRLALAVQDVNKEIQFQPLIKIHINLRK